MGPALSRGMTGGVGMTGVLLMLRVPCLAHLLRRVHVHQNRRVIDIKEQHIPGPRAQQFAQLGAGLERHRLSPHLASQPDRMPALALVSRRDDERAPLGGSGQHGI